MKNCIVEPLDLIAQEVYCAMAWASHEANGKHVPLWTPGGNSLAQDEARRAARAISHHQKNQGSLSIEVNGYTIEMPLSEWHRIASDAIFRQETEECSEM
jgi:hypothetical protein